jgi:NAD(P) transhydrogenase
MAPYDLIVLGSGPAGEKGAATAAAFGRRVAVVERDAVVGGASANTGTVPSKTLRETALALSGLRTRALHGVDLSLRRDATVRDFLHHEGRVKENERQRVVENFRRGNVDLFRGLGSFTDPHTIRVSGGGSGEVELRAAKILIATGSSPLRPKEFLFSDARVHDSDEILEIERLPRTLAVIGAGVIGAEYACTFAALGCQVDLIDGRDILLGFLDREISQALEQSIGRLGIRFHKKNKVTRCEVTDSGWLSVVCDTGLALEVDQVLVAAGRSANTAKLNLAAAGITPGPKGVIEVNPFFQTSNPDIYAAGDVIGYPALSATSAEQGRLAMSHAFDLNFKHDMTPLLPTGIYTIPEVSCIGATEEELKEKGSGYFAGRASYDDNARGEIIGDTSGYLKLLFTRSDNKLAGVHVIGEHASEVVHAGMMVMLAGAGTDLLSRACFNYPTLGDLYKTATYDALMNLGGRTATNA